MSSLQLGRRGWLLGVTFAALVLIAAGCSSDSDGTLGSTPTASSTSTTAPSTVSESSGFSIEEDVVYGQGEVDGGGSFQDLLLDLYVPDPRPEEPIPLIVMVHGGGFVTGNKKDGEIARPAEAYATSGPRIKLRFLGGWDYPEQLCEPTDWIRLG